MHKARITPARSSSHTLYMHIYTLTHTHTHSHTATHTRSPIRALHHLRITLHYADFLPFSLNILPSTVVAVVVVVVFYRPPYLLLLHGLRLKKIFLFNLFMNEMAVAGACCSGRLGNKGNCLCLRLCLSFSLSAVPPLLELLAFSVAGAYRIVT